MTVTQSPVCVGRPAGLRQRGKSWEIRVRVPDRLRGKLPTEIVRSFGAIAFKDACRRGWAERASIERLFEKTEAEINSRNRSPERSKNSSFSEAQLISFGSLLLRELERCPGLIPLDDEAQQELSDSLSEEAFALDQPGSVDDAGLQSFADEFAQRLGIECTDSNDRYRFINAIRIGYSTHLKRQIARISGAPVGPENAALAGANTLDLAEATTTLSEAVNMYVSAPERAANTGKSLGLDRSRLRPICDILGAEKSVGSITKADLRVFVDQLNRLPIHYTTIYRGMSVVEAIAAGAAAGKRRLSSTSIERAIQAVKSMFCWLEREDIIAKNPAQQLKAPKVVRSGRRPYEPAEMGSLLHATSAATRGKRDWSYWCVRIAMLQGLRLTEPLGLKVGDFFRAEGVLAIRLRPNDLRRLKNEVTARDIPVHPRLIELGIEELFADRSTDEPLLPDAPRGNGNSFNAAQKQLMRIVRKRVSTDPNLVIHSLRHSFRDAMRNAGFPRSVEERLGGWKSDGSSSMENYGHGHRLNVLYEYIGKIAYDGVYVD